MSHIPYPASYLVQPLGVLFHRFALLPRDLKESGLIYELIIELVDNNNNAPIHMKQGAIGSKMEDHPEVFFKEKHEK